MVKFIKQTTILIILGILVFPSCTKENLKENLGVFNPEIINSAGNFELQATDVSNVSESVEFLWVNPGAKANPNVRANIDNSSVIDKGTATIKIIDAQGNEVYSGNLNEHGSYTSDYGIPGTWTIELNLSEVSGDLNINVEEE